MLKEKYITNKVLQTVIMNKTFREILSDSGRGTLSSKRIMGVVIFVVCLGCIIYLTITAGATPIIENLLQTAMFMGAALLGISSVTNIWSNKPPKNNINTNENNEV